MVSVGGQVSIASNPQSRPAEPWDTTDPEELDSGDARPPSQGVTKKAGRNNNA